MPSRACRCVAPCGVASAGSWGRRKARTIATDGGSFGFGFLPITNSNREMTFCRTMVEFWLTNLEKQKLPTGLPAGPRSLPPHFGPFYPQVDRFFAIKFLWTNGGQRSTWDELYFSRTFQEFGQTDCA